MRLPWHSPTPIGGPPGPPAARMGSGMLASWATNVLSRRYAAVDAGTSTGRRVVAPPGIGQAWNPLRPCVRCEEGRGGGAGECNMLSAAAMKRQGRLAQWSCLLRSRQLKHGTNMRSICNQLMQNE